MSLVATSALGALRTIGPYPYFASLLSFATAPGRSSALPASPIPGRARPVIIPAVPYTYLAMHCY